MSSGRRRNSDHGSTNSYADLKPRLVSLGEQRRDKRLKDELYGEAQKKGMSKVSMPKFSWDKKDD
jgi:hypothetical protein